MPYYVPYTPDANGVITTSFSVYDYDQDNLSITSVQVVMQNGVHITPSTPAWLTYTTSGTYLVPGGYKGSMSKLDVYLYIDTDHPNIETGSQYVIRCNYTDGVNNKSTDIVFFNGDFDFWYSPNLFAWVGLHEEGMTGFVNPTDTIKSHISSSYRNDYFYSYRIDFDINRVETLSNVFGYSISSYGFSHSLGTSVYFYFTEIINKTIDNLYIFIPLLIYSSSGLSSNQIRLSNLFHNIDVIRVEFTSNPNIFRTTCSLPSGRNTFLVTISSTTISYTDAMLLFFFKIENNQTNHTLSVYVNNIKLKDLYRDYPFILPSLSYIYLGLYYFWCNDITIYTGKLSDEEIRIIHNKYFYKYYPFLRSHSFYVDGVLV